MSWEEGIGDDKKYHIAHICPAGVTLVLKIKEYSKWQEAIADAKLNPSETVEILLELPKAAQLTAAQISKATYTEQLNQLSLFDLDGKKTKIPEGKVQAEIFAAVRDNIGGTEREEDADAWSVMQSPLLTLGIVGVIGGFSIWFTTICEADYQPTGRRSGMKALLNWVGYTVGPVWSSVIVGSIAALVLGLMTFQLINRPKRNVLEFSR